MERTGEGRAINRHDYTVAEIETSLDRPVVRRIVEVVKLRASHPAFGGELSVTTTGPGSLRLTRSHDADVCQLEVNVLTGQARITGRDSSGTLEFVP